DQLGRIEPLRGVEVTLVVDVGDARSELVGPGDARLARLVGPSGLDERVITHLGFTLRLAVDRPVWPMVVRRAALGAHVAVRKYAEAQLRILVQDLAFRRLVGDVGRDELLVLEILLQQGADLAAAGRVVLLLQNVMAGGSELLDGMFGW